jgi:hypothetical protein
MKLIQIYHPVVLSIFYWLLATFSYHQTFLGIRI